MRKERGACPTFDRACFTAIDSTNVSLHAKTGFFGDAKFTTNFLDALMHFFRECPIFKATRTRS